MYRMVKRSTPLATGQKYGDIIRDGELKPEVINRLLRGGTLVRVSTPPLSELPDWDRQAEILAKVGVRTISELAEYDAIKLAKEVKKPVRIIKQWQDEALAWLNPTPSKESG